MEEPPPFGGERQHALTEGQAILQAMQKMQRSQMAIWKEIQTERAVRRREQGDREDPERSHGSGSAPLPIDNAYFLTREDISQILLEARRIEDSFYADVRLPYLEVVAQKLYPANYVSPMFPKLDGKTGNAS